MRGEPGASEVDALFAALLRAGENRPGLRKLLEAPLEEQVLLAVLHRAVPVAFLEELAARPPWSERPFVLARIVLSPRAPRALGLRLVSALHWRELAEVAGTMRLAAAVRLRAEGLLRDVMPELRLGDRIALARLATPPIVGLLLRDSEPRVVDAALENPRLREEDLVTALRANDLGSALIAAAASSSRWSVRYAVRLALALSPRTPLAIALAQVSACVPRDLLRLAEDKSLHPLLRATARGILEQS